MRNDTQHTDAVMAGGQLTKPQAAAKQNYKLGSE